MIWKRFKNKLYIFIQSSKLAAKRIAQGCISHISFYFLDVEDPILWVLTLQNCLEDRSEGGFAARGLTCEELALSANEPSV